MEILVKYLPIIEAVLATLGALVILATAIVRLTPSKDDDAVVGKISGYWMKLIMFLPTLGINPQTQKLQAAYEDLKAKVDAKPQ